MFLQIIKAFTAHIVPIFRKLGNQNAISVSGLAASNKSTSGSAVFFFFTIMTSQMKLDDLVQERQLPHLEICCIAVIAGTFDFHQTKVPGKPIQTAR